MSGQTEAVEAWPGEQLGLPETGRGSLASWRARITAIVLDWAVCTIAAWALFGPLALRGGSWRSFTTLGLFFVMSALLTAFVGGTVGQLITRIAVVRLDHEPLGLLRAAGRALLVCLGLPALVIGAHRRGLHDLACGTVVVNRR
ncbi:RDD family protein [Naumannella sp. ID2617S]|uniref:RDD family protein n=1 Tax=Enemella dayhoffiae TaxID=2016507 RepID=A0A255H1Q2_9ACTN|nr:RDD family protein [Enemella dayhoffiae]NNG18447.1 RDD family protein [Naumannella sp. ID2617S]OYO21615.1 RDD family protein [Enemella dayhoffiae]